MAIDFCCFAKNRLLPCSWIFASLVVLGCAHYRLGPPGGTTLESIHVDTVINESIAPQVQALLTQNLIEAFLRDGTVRVASPETAAATLRVVVSNFGRDRGATSGGDTVRARSYQLSLSADVTLVDNLSGRAYFENRSIEAVETAYLDDGLPQAEYDAMPVLAVRLANRIKDAVTGDW